MVIKLSELLKKVENKKTYDKYTPPSNASSKIKPITKPWQTECIFVNEGNGAGDPIVLEGLGQDKTDSDASINGENIVRIQTQEGAKYNHYRVFDEPVESQKTECKPSANRVQTECKEGANWAQTGCNPSANRVQTECKEGANWVQTECESGAQPSANRVQTERNKNEEVPLTSLAGLQKEVIIFVYKQCQLSRTDITDQLSIEHITESLDASSNSIKSAIKRLEKKGCIIRREFKSGRGGWSRYEIPERLFREVLLAQERGKLSANMGQIEGKSGAQLGASSSSSSSIKDINKTTTRTEPTSESVLSPEWEDIDCEPLEFIKFKKSHVMQIAARGKLTPAMLQDSINFFAFDLKKNNKASKIDRDPLIYFMGIVGKGNGYTPPANYVSPQTEFSRECKEAWEADQRKRDNIEKDWVNMAFEKWESSLTDEDVRGILPDEVYRDKDKEGMHQRNAKAHLKDHFKKNEWPSIREAIIKSTKTGG